ncbi:MAG: phenylalanine--tRNA ligase subunit beta, partial [Clostridia bacterium]|nr:phenylalanine--tRNA ligase subunit beta [Clostridia bacterium]
RAGRLFEIGSTYIPKALPLTELPEEKEKLMIAFYGEGEDYYTIKNVIDDIFRSLAIKVNYVRSATEYLHPGRSADIFALDGTKLGVVGEIHPDVMAKLDVDKRIYVAELDVVYLVENGLDIKPFRPISKYQSVERDLALIAPKELPAAEIVSLIKNSCSDLLQDAFVFDVYTGGQVQKGKKSVAVRLLFTDFTKTLTDETINKEIDNVLAGFAEKSVSLR